MTLVDFQGPRGGVPTRVFSLQLEVVSDRFPYGHSMLSLAIAIVATVLLAGAFPRLRETTLRLPLAWTVLAFWLLAGADLVSDNPAASFLFSAWVMLASRSAFFWRRMLFWRSIFFCTEGFV